MNKLLVSVSIAVAVIAGFVVADNIINPAQAKDCSASAVVQCGVWSVEEMRQSYNTDKTKGTQNIFSGMGITSAMVNGSTVKEGTVGKDGRVIVDGKVVATNAVSAGRTVMSHTTEREKKVYNGTVYYQSSTSDSFRSKTLDSYVLFDAQGRFQGAIVKDCGNPVTAVPEPIDIEVCRLSDNKYPVTIKENEYDETKYSKNPNDCKTIEVCRLEDKKYPVVIKETQYDETKYSKNPEDCKTPGISITKTVDGVDHKAVGKNVEFTYEINVKNTGDKNLKNVVVTDNAEAGVTFLKASAGEVKDRSWTYTIAELKVGETKKFTITAKVPEYKAGIIKNTVCVDAPEVPGNPDDCDDATVEVPKPEEENVCRLEDKKYPVTIKKEDFDSKLYSRDQADCKTTPVTPVTPVTPPVTELPRTGVADGLLSAIGLGALTTAIVAYGASRRQ